MRNPVEISLSRRSFLKAAVASAACSAAPALLLGETKGLREPAGSELTRLSLAEAAELVRRKKVSPVELTQACLARIEQFQPVLNVFITITADSALAEARAAESEIQRGNWRGPLHGIPIALKDLIDTAGVKTTAASGLFADRIPTEDAEVVRRLKAAGAVCLGKLNLHELAEGGTSLISYFGPVRNPWNSAYIAGGSSGGSAAAVAAELCYGALGSDTGGSIRQPAAFCNIVGLKATYGLVSTRGVIPLSWSADHIGPMTRTVADSALLLQAIAGYDPAEPNSRQVAITDYSAALGRKTSALRLGVPRMLFFQDLHPEVEKATGEALAVLDQLTAGHRDIGMPVTAYDYSVMSAEIYSYHSAFIAANRDRFQPETLRRSLAGAAVTPGEYFESRRSMEDLRARIQRVFEDVDLFITPTTPCPPLSARELMLMQETDALWARELFALRNTSPFNLYGLPTITVPCGFTQQGLPLGLQISGPSGGEATVLRLAHAFEQATEWHKRRPPLARDSRSV